MKALKPFLTFILLGPFIGGAVLAAGAFPFIAVSGGVIIAIKLSVAFIVFSPIVGVIPAAISVTLIHYFKGERQGKTLTFYAAKASFFATFLLALLVTCTSKGSEADWAIPLSFDVTLLTNALALIAGSALFGLLGLVPGYVCAKVGYEVELTSGNAYAL